MPSIYDYPLYYDILFGWDRDGEADFYGSAFLHYGVPRSGRILEMGCGTGQIALRMARRGWLTSAMDNRPPMLSFLQEQARRSGLVVGTICADMCSFSLSKTQHAIYCPMNTFRMIPDDSSVLHHLTSVARDLESGGLYLVDIHFESGMSASSSGSECWSWAMRRGGIEIHASEQGIVVRTGRELPPLTLEWGSEMRSYTNREFEETLRKSGALTPIAYHPECGKSEAGVSLFDINQTRPFPVVGRTIAVLGRAS